MRCVRLLSLSLGLMLAGGALAIEPKPLSDVNIGDLTRETQKTIHAEGVHLVWWIPAEYWAASVASDASMSEDQRKSLMDIMEKYSMLGIVQAEVTPFGSFTFYDREVVSQGMKIEVIDGKDRKTVKPIEKIPEELQLLLKVVSPILEAALGNLGKNLNFFVLSDRVKGDRLVSPYGNVSLSVTLSSKKGTAFEPVIFEMPLDALYIPRPCPNGKPAHVSWVVCPWDGSPLPK